MTIEEIKELIQVFNESGVSEMEVTRGGNGLRLKRASVAMSQEILVPMGAPIISAAPIHALPSTSPAAPTGINSGANNASASAKPATLEEGHELVKSPIVGTYYDSPAPGSPSFVRVGDQVEPGHVLCIIESMKLMNEIESEVSGTIVAKLVENGRPVEYGEALFAIRPR